jgi:hypothetical protein
MGIQGAAAKKSARVLVIRSTLDFDQAQQCFLECAPSPCSHRATGLVPPLPAGRPLHKP